MPYTVVLHMLNEDPALAEIEELPKPDSTCVICRDVRRRDGKPVHYLTSEAVAFVFPMSRIGFIEVLPGEGERSEVIEFYRD